MYCLAGPLDRSIVASGQIVSQRNTGKAEKDARIARIGTDRDFLVGDRFVDPAYQAQCCSETAVSKRTVRIELYRAFQGGDGFFMFAQTPTTDSEGPVRIFVAIVEPGCAPGQLAGGRCRRLVIVDMTHEPAVMMD